MTVIPVPGADVGGNLLVAVKAQAGLAVAVTAVVTGRAAFLVLLVRSAELARHEQRFRVHGFSSRTQAETQEKAQYPQRATFSSPHAKAVCLSVHVYRYDMHDTRDDHHEDEWQVQRMPKRKETLVGLESGDTPRGSESAVDIGKHRSLQSG